MLRLIISIVSIVLFQNVTANEKAQKFATDFFKKKQSTEIQKAPSATSSVQLVYASADTVKNELFVYQATKKGFIIVSSIGNNFQVIGYSSNSTFEKDNLPVQFKGLLALYESTAPTHFSGIKAAENATIIVEPLLNIAGIHLNQFYHAEVGNCPTGCVATAMAQILAYHKYPDRGKGSKCYTAGSYGQQCADFENTWYNWTNPTDDDYKLLSKHIGVATEMGYCLDKKTGGSSPQKSNYISVLRDNFRMNIYVNGNTPNDYIFTELDQKRPVYLELWGDPGHALVADGYDSNNFLHLNFGWGGSYDGFYLMNTNTTFNVGSTFGTNIASTLFVSTKPFTVDKQDSLNLVAINSKLNNKWDFSKPISDWAGIKIIGGKVVELNLSSGSSIQGEIPSEIGNFDKLRSLSIAGNLSGQLPAAIFNITSLENLSILNYSGNPNLNSTLPISINNLGRLKLLYLNNCISGSIPETIGDLTNLQSLNLFNNKLSGQIPATICKLTKLTELELSQNQFSGNIPENIGNLNLLIYFQFAKNQLTGQIPASVGNLKKLSSFSVENNKLSGNLPESINSCRLLTSINLSQNELSGLFPEIGDSLTKIATLNISSNKFTALPQSIGNLKELVTLIVSANQLSQLPNSLSTCVKLRIIDASSNQLSSLPVDFVLINNLTELNLSGNQFETIPPSLEFMFSLKTLNFANNKLTTIPDYLGRFSLNSLILSNNNLSGTIPEKILTKSYTHFLLNGNNFTYSDIPVSDSLRNRIGDQKPVLFNKKTFSALLGDTLRLQASQILSKTLRTNTYSWYEYVDATQAAPYRRWLATDSVLTLPVTEFNMKKKYFCEITNESVSKYLYSGFLRLNCIDKLTTDTFQLVGITKEETLNEQYQTTVLQSERLKAGTVSDNTVTLISPWKVRGRQQWQGSTDKSSWVDLTSSMSASTLKSNIVSVSEKDLKLFPKTTAFYRNALLETNCNPQYSDTIKVIPWGKIICDTLINVAKSDKTIRVDSIEVTIPKGTSTSNLKLTVIKSTQKYTYPDSLKFMSPVYDVSVSSGSTFDNPIIIKFKNLNKKNFSLMDIEKYKPAYFDEQLNEWVFYDNANINFKDSSLTFSTYHLTKLAWFELAHAGYTHIFTNDRVNVIYKSGDGFNETMWLYEYDKLASGSFKPWESADYDPDKGGTPFMIRDIAALTKQVIDKFQQEGISTPSLRFNVYVTNLGKGAAGATDAGSFLAGRGYIYIDPNVVVGSQGDKPTYKNVNDYLKSTIAHEYMHFTQDYYMTVLLSNYTWMEATAPLADRIVWGENALTLCEPEYLLTEAKMSTATEKSIFDILSMPWYNSYNIPIVSKVAAGIGSKSGEYNLSSLFLHYMRTYREGNKLNPVDLLKETSYLESWVGYLNSFIKSKLNSDVGSEFENYVKFLFEGSKENFNLFESKDDEDPLKYFKACLSRSVVNKTIVFE
ncbi:MAG: C10 family peptidase, partial [Paludibacter sp.]|nr:C10 family peptidase [Paludibacter sp.]